MCAEIPGFTVFERAKEPRRICSKCERKGIAPDCLSGRKLDVLKLWPLGLNAGGENLRRVDWCLSAIDLAEPGQEAEQSGTSECDLLCDLVKDESESSVPPSANGPDTAPYRTSDIRRDTTFSHGFAPLEPRFKPEGMQDAQSNTAGLKRYRHPEEPQDPRKRPRQLGHSRHPGTAICVHCWKHGLRCDHKATCTHCRRERQQCEYRRCRFGHQCAHMRCCYVHPSQEATLVDARILNGSFPQKVNRHRT